MSLSARQQPESGNPVHGTDIYPSIRDGWHNEFVALAKMVSLSNRLIAVVQLTRKIRGIVSVQYRHGTVLRCPDDCSACPVARDTRRCSWIWEGIATFRFGSGGKEVTGETKRL